MDPAALPRTASHKALIAIGVFLLFGSSMAALAGTTLLWRGTVLDRVWILNQAAYRQLFPLGRSIGLLFFLLSVLLAVASFGWFQHYLWGWRLAVAIIAAQVAEDLINLVSGDLVRGSTGLIIAGALLIYLLRPKVRAAFH
jgi:hypothetical protein